MAPSPTGELHVGSLSVLLKDYAVAKQNAGQFVMRIEDTDQERLVPGAMERIIEIVRAYGLDWDEGPDKGGPYGPYVQSQRLELYQAHATELINKGQAYYCFCSKERLEELRTKAQAEGKPTRYDRRCSALSPEEVAKRLAAGESHVIRLRVPDNQTITFTDLIRGEISFNSSEIDDPILLKSDGFPTYHLAVVIDDHLMKISHILRGVEWISSTPKHLLLYQAFGWEIPQIGHFPVILGPDKAKLSKRHGAKSVLDYRDEGYLPEALVTFMAYLGWSYQDNSELLSIDRLIDLFDLKRIQVGNPIFDIQKLDYFNAKLIRSLPLPKLIQLIKPFLKIKISDALINQIMSLIQERLVKLGEINDLVEYFVSQPKIDAPAVLKESGMPAKDTSEYLSQVSGVVSRLSAWSVADLEKKLHELQTKLGLKPRPAFMTIRLAVTGRQATPPLFDVLHILGKAEVIKRLTYAQKTLSHR